MYLIRKIRLITDLKLVSVFAHEDTNNFIFTKYMHVLFDFIILCSDTEQSIFFPFYSILKKTNKKIS